MMLRRAPFAALGSVLALLASPAANATDFDFSGNFTFDNDVALFNFTVGAPSTVTLFSSSWLAVEPPAGFDPMLGVWQADGTLVNFQDDGEVAGATLSNGVSYNHGVWDSFFQISLPAGNYIASVTQYNNFNVSSNLADGFTQDGNPNFTNDLGFGGATQPLFNGVADDNDPRTSHWEFHILDVESAIQPPGGAPEPATWLLIAGAGALLARRRRHRL